MKKTMAMRRRKKRVVVDRQKKEECNLDERKNERRQEYSYLRGKNKEKQMHSVSTPFVYKEFFSDVLRSIKGF